MTGSKHSTLHLTFSDLTPSVFTFYSKRLLFTFSIYINPKTSASIRPHSSASMSSSNFFNGGLLQSHDKDENPPVLSEIHRFRTVKLIDLRLEAPFSYTT